MAVVGELNELKNFLQNEDTVVSANVHNLMKKGFTLYRQCASNGSCMFYALAYGLMESCVRNEKVRENTLFHLKECGELLHLPQYDIDDINHLYFEQVRIQTK